MSRQITAVVNPLAMRTTPILTLTTACLLSSCGFWHVDQPTISIDLPHLQSSAKRNLESCP